MTALPPCLTTLMLSKVLDGQYRLTEITSYTNNIDRISRDQGTARLVCLLHAEL